MGMIKKNLRAYDATRQGPKQVIQSGSSIIKKTQLHKHLSK